jgi:phospholipid/cholesterol/gamma-HCH transport system permease protein
MKKAMDASARSLHCATVELNGAGDLAVSGYWTALATGAVEKQIETLLATKLSGSITVNGAGVEALDTVGVWLLQRLLQQLQQRGTVELRGWQPQHTKLLDLVAQNPLVHAAPLPQLPVLEQLGQTVIEALQQFYALLSFTGECARAMALTVAHPTHLRWRSLLQNIHSAGFNALPIVGLLSFLLGIVVAYQSAEQLRRYGANIYVVDLVGLSMLREFAPLMTAIIVAGRSGSAYAAQIGTMQVNEEIDAMRTLGIPPLESLVLPKVLGLLIAMPLLTVFADVLGIFGGMIMARAQLDVGYMEFLDRLVNAVDIPAYLIGIGKAPVFAIIIAMVGCFQGFRTSGGADSVGRQTTRSVVQAIFLVILADALFSILFSILDL